MSGILSCCCGAAFCIGSGAARGTLGNGKFNRLDRSLWNSRSCCGNTCRCRSLLSYGSFNLNLLNYGSRGRLGSSCRRGSNRLTNHGSSFRYLGCRRGGRCCGRLIRLSLLKPFLLLALKLHKSSFSFIGLMVCLHLVNGHFVKLFGNRTAGNLACILCRLLFAGRKIEGVEISCKYAVRAVVKTKLGSLCLCCRLLFCSEVCISNSAGVHTVVKVERLVSSSTSYLGLFLSNHRLFNNHLGVINKRRKTVGRCVLLDAKLLDLYVGYVALCLKEFVVNKLLTLDLALVLIGICLYLLLLFNVSMVLVLNKSNTVLGLCNEIQRRLAKRSCLLGKEEYRIYRKDHYGYYNCSDVAECICKQISDRASDKSAVVHIDKCFGRGEVNSIIPIYYRIFDAGNNRC